MLLKNFIFYQAPILFKMNIKQPVHVICFVAS